MENLSYLLLILAAATLVVALYLVFRIKAVLYLLQQPVVKKMSPQLRLKPVKLDEAVNRNGGNREGRGERRDENRGERRDGDRNRDGRRDENRGERREGGRPEGRRDENRGEGRGERRDENRGERRDGERNRDGNRGEGRGERREGRENRPPREFSETRDFAPAVTSEAAPASEPALSPRRPLASFDAPSESVETSAPAAPSAAETFVGSSDDMQHGRRTQLKKKPRFDIEEDETTAA